MLIEEYTIELRDVHLFAHHGVMQQEREIGAWFTIDICISLENCTGATNDKIEGTVSSICTGLSETFSDIEKRNEPNKCKGIMLAIKTSEAYELTMGEISDMLDVLNKHNPDVDIIWSLATKSSLQAEELELILLVGVH